MFFCILNRYGDLSPRSIPARTFALIWFLTGLILNGLIVGFIVTNLTSLSASEDLMLYDSKVFMISSYKTVQNVSFLLSVYFIFYFIFFIISL